MAPNSAAPAAPAPQQQQQQQQQQQSQQQQQQQQQQQGLEEAASQPSASPMEHADDHEEGAQPIVKPDISASQSGNSREVEAEEQRRPDGASKEPFEDAADRAERLIYEDEVLERARAIEKARATTTKACPDPSCLALLASQGWLLGRLTPTCAISAMIAH